MYLLGLDIGSSSIKASLIQASDGLVVAQNFEPKEEMNIIAHQNGWAEQNPETWWSYVKLIVPKLIKGAQIDKSFISAIGISYQMHGLVLVDKNKQILRPSIIWCDSRASEIGKDAFNTLGQTYCLENLFNSPGNFTASKLKWVKDNEPEIFDAIKKGAILENVILDENGQVDFTNTSITQNTRVSYPINHIENIQIPSIGKNPKNIFFLTADAFGVLPPISKLTPSQAAYHFISGYTAKVAGTEAGVVEPVPSFSACFGAPFMPLHPSKYAEILSKKMIEAGVNVWLVNTGWTGGPYGIGTRMKLKYTRAMINAVLNGDLGLYTYDTYHIHSVFGVAQPRECPGVPTSVLSPRATWNDDEAYYKTAFKLTNAFRENFKKFEMHCNEEIRRGGPQRYAH